MIMHIESPHVDLGTKLENTIEERFDHLGRKYNQIKEAEITLRKVKEEHTRECLMEAKIIVYGKTLFASEQEETFEEALRKLLIDLEHQLRKYKEEMEEMNRG